MSMEPFDYLSYKKNKSLSNRTPSNRAFSNKTVNSTSHSSKSAEIAKRRKIKTAIVCIVTFFTILIPMLFFIASKSSKVDIEYGRFGQEGDNPYGLTTEVIEIDEEDNDNTEDDIKPAKYTIDKRLFLIMQEEKGPSKSKVVQKDKNQAEVISKEQFEMIKNNSSDVTGKKPENKEEEIKRDIKEPENKPELSLPAATPLKPVIKPKIAPPPPKPIVPKPAIKAYDSQLASKVLIGKYSSSDEAKEVQAKLSGVIQGGNPYIKRIGTYYSIQIGVYDNFETAKSIASRLQTRGFEAWIMQ